MSITRKTTLACLVFELSALDLVPFSKPCPGHNSKTIWNMHFTFACMALRQCVMKKEDNFCLFGFELSALDLRSI